MMFPAATIDCNQMCIVTEIVRIMLFIRIAFDELIKNGLLNVECIFITFYLCVYDSFKSTEMYTCVKSIELSK